MRTRLLSGAGISGELVGPFQVRSLWETEKGMLFVHLTKIILGESSLKFYKDNWAQHRVSAERNKYTFWWKEYISVFSRENILHIVLDELSKMRLGDQRACSMHSRSITMCTSDAKKPADKHLTVSSSKFHGNNLR